MTGADGAAPPRAAHIPARVWKIAAITGAGAFLAMLDSTVAHLAIESIRADLRSTLPIVQWVATGYLIALAVSLPAAGWLGGRLGYGRAWALGLAAFAGASALCALASGPSTLIAARVAQGLAAGVMIPAGQAVVGSVARPGQLGRLFGVLGLAISLGPALGPAFGGVLLDAASWRWLFWINVPIALVALVAARNVVPGGSTAAARRLDGWGLALLSTGLPLVLWGATEMGARSASPVTLLAVGAGAALIAAFAIRALHVPLPLVDLGLLRGRTFAAATATTGFAGASMFGGLLLLPLYLQLAGQLDTVDTGLLLLALGLGATLALPIGGALTDRYGAGPVTFVGALLLVAGTAPFVVPGVPSTPVLVAILVARGAGLALAQMPPTTAAYAAVGPDQMGDATTLVNIAQRAGGAVGAAAIVVVLAQAGGATSEGAYAWAFAALTAISALALVSAAILGGHPSPRRRRAAAGEPEQPALDPVGAVGTDGGRAG